MSEDDGGQIGRGGLMIASTVFAILFGLGGGYAYIDTTMDREHDKIETTTDALDDRLLIIETDAHRQAAQRAVWRYEEALDRAKKAGNQSRIKEIEQKLRKANKELKDAGG